MLILGENETCPHNKKCPNKKHEGLVDGFCDGLNPFRNTVFKCELVRNDGTIVKFGGRSSLNNFSKFRHVLIYYR